MTGPAACGGSVVGTWTVTSSCLQPSGPINLLNLAAGTSTQPCTTGQFTGGSLQVTGTWTGKSGGTYTDNTTTTGSETFTLPASCLYLSGSQTTCDLFGTTLSGIGFETGTCIDAPSGGGCTCTATVNQSGGLGFVSVDSENNGTYTTSNNSLTDTADNAVDPYCVSGTTLTVTPQGLTGTIVLQQGGTTMSSSSSSNGVSGSSGATSSVSASGSSTASHSSSSMSSSGAATPATGPCDIYAAANPPTPCVAAHSTTRVLLSTYTGPLYQVRKGGTNNYFAGGAGGSNSGPAIGTVGGTTGGTTQDIGFTAGGYADYAAQDAFCGQGAASTCTVSKIYDQSGKGNNLTEAPAGQWQRGPDWEVPVGPHSLTLNGRTVYSLYFPKPPPIKAGDATSSYGYRNDKTTGMPTGTTGQSVYMIVDGTYSGTGCCFDYGNAETNDSAGATGTMAALNYGTTEWGEGNGTGGQWFEGDFETGVWAGGSSCGTPGFGQLSGCTGGRVANTNNPSMKTIPYAFGVFKTWTSNSSPNWELEVADATSGSLTVAYNGAAPANFALQGGLLLGIGGDNSNSSWGDFFEGAVTTGYPTDATVALVLANAQAAKYGK